MATATYTAPRTDADLAVGLEQLAAQGHVDVDTAWELLDQLALQTGRSIGELCHLAVLGDLSYADLPQAVPAAQRA